MQEFRTRSALLSIADGVSRVLSAREQIPDIEALLPITGRTPTLPGLSNHEITCAVRTLMRALKEEAHLSPFGALVARWDIETRLANLRRLREEETQFPEITEEPI